MKYAKFERLGVTHEGADVVVLLEGREIRMPWKVAMMLSRNIGVHAIEARKNDTEFNQVLQEVSRG